MELDVTSCWLTTSIVHSVSQNGWPPPLPVSHNLFMSLNLHGCFSGTTSTKEHKGLSRWPSDVIFQLFQLLNAPIENFHRLLAGMQMLEDFSDDLTLRRSVLLSHGPVHQLEGVLVEVVNEVIEVLLMGFGAEALASNPLNVVLFVDAVVLFHLLRQKLITVMTQQFYGFLKILK